MYIYLFKLGHSFVKLYFFTNLLCVNYFFSNFWQFGKDFDAIQNLIVQRHKKKGDPDCIIKNKDQVRHFFYRTWHKISKYIDHTEGMTYHVSNA